jgi:hypothetical protein
VDAGPATRMINVAELSGAGRVKQTFRAGKSRRPDPRLSASPSRILTPHFPDRDDVPLTATTCGSQRRGDDWKKIRPTGQIVERFLQIQRSIKIDLTETAAHSASLRVAWPVLSRRVPNAIRPECKASREGPVAYVSVSPITNTNPIASELPNARQNRDSKRERSVADPKKLTRGGSSDMPTHHEWPRSRWVQLR